MTEQGIIATGLVKLETLFQELKMDVHFDVEVVIDETDDVRLLFGGYTEDGVRVQQLVTTLPGIVRREIWNEGLRSYDIVSGNPVESRGHERLPVAEDER